MGDRGVQALAGALEVNQGLKLLQLRGEWLFVLGKEEFGVVAPSCVSDCSGNGISAAGLEMLASALRSNTTLQKLIFVEYVDACHPPLLFLTALLCSDGRDAHGSDWLSCAFKRFARQCGAGSPRACSVCLE